MTDFLTINKRTATKKLLETKNTDKKNGSLPLKDEDDVESVRQAASITHRRLHNQLTNRLRRKLDKYTLLEGRDKSCMFDVLVTSYDKAKNDLLVEVKSSIESAHVRMAVGQIFHYSFVLKDNKDPHLAILLPHQPSAEIVSFLQSRRIGLLWFENHKLCTEDSWLACIAPKN